MSCNFSPRGRFRWTTHLEAKEVLTQSTGQGKPPLCSPLEELQLARTSQKGVQALVWIPEFFPAITEEVTSNSSGLEASRAYHCSPTGLYIFAYYESCYLRVYIPISLKLCNNRSHSLQHLQVLAAPQQLGPIKNKPEWLGNPRFRGQPRVRER